MNFGIFSCFSHDFFSRSAINLSTPPLLHSELQYVFSTRLHRSLSLYKLRYLTTVDSSFLSQESTFLPLEWQNITLTYARRFWVGASDNFVCVSVWLLRKRPNSRSISWMWIHELCLCCLPDFPCLIQDRSNHVECFQCKGCYSIKSKQDLVTSHAFISIIETIVA